MNCDVTNIRLCKTDGFVGGNSSSPKMTGTGDMIELL